jgi:hypothetical protein
MSTLDICLACATFISTAIAIWQFVTARKMRNILKAKCRNEYMRIIDVACRLSRSAKTACSIIHQLNNRASKCTERRCGILVPQVGQAIDSMYSYTGTLGDCCLGLNTAFCEEFGESLPVDQTTLEQLTPCVEFE